MSHEGGWWGGKSQVMNYSLRILKGKRIVLQERGVNIRGMNFDKIREILASHPDFMNKKILIECYLAGEKGHIVYLLPSGWKLL